MEPKINIGEITVNEYNLIMKLLQTGQLGECIDFFMRMRQIGAEFQQAQQANKSQPQGPIPTEILPPPAA